jgi:predicted anti-sigma-YlaC factor YlaD
MNCSQFADLLDAYIDGELDASARVRFEKHADQCEECRNQLRAAEQLRDFLSQMDDDIAVPLPAQAAWRSAVRREARSRNIKRIYSVVGAVAAVCVMTIGVTTMLRSPGQPDAPVAGRSLDAQQVAFVQTDGLSETAVLDASAQPLMQRMAVKPDASYHECRVVTEDIPAACGYLIDIATEYGALVESEAEVDGEKRVYVHVSAENAQEFLTAVANLGSNAGEQADWTAEDVAVVEVCVVFVAE